MEDLEQAPEKHEEAARIAFVEAHPATGVAMNRGKLLVARIQRYLSQLPTPRLAPEERARIEKKIEDLWLAQEDGHPESTG